LDYTLIKIIRYLVSN